jgi:hypothetical protein
MLRDTRMAGLVKLHRSTGRTNERQQWAVSADAVWRILQRG